MLHCEMHAQSLNLFHQTQEIPEKAIPRLDEELREEFEGLASTHDVHKPFDRKAGNIDLGGQNCRCEEVHIPRSPEGKVFKRVEASEACTDLIEDVLLHNSLKFWVPTFAFKEKSSWWIVQPRRLPLLSGMYELLLCKNARPGHGYEKTYFLTEDREFLIGHDLREENAGYDQRSGESQFFDGRMQSGGFINDPQCLKKYPEQINRLLSSPVYCLKLKRRNEIQEIRKAVKRSSKDFPSHFEGRTFFTCCGGQSYK